MSKNTNDSFKAVYQGETVTTVKNSAHAVDNNVFLSVQRKGEKSSFKVNIDRLSMDENRRLNIKKMVAKSQHSPDAQMAYA